MDRKMTLTRFKASDKGLQLTSSEIINEIELPMGILGSINGKGYVEKLSVYRYIGGRNTTMFDIIRPDKVRALIAYSQRVQVDIALNNGFPHIFNQPVTAAIYLSWVKVLKMALQKEIDFKDQDDVFITIETVEG